MDKQSSNFPIDPEYVLEYESHSIPKQTHVPSTSSKKFDLNPSNYPDKFRNFVRELSLINENIKLANVINS